jgi:hypothetical protein
LGAARLDEQDVANISRLQMTPDERNELQIRRICRAYEWQQRSVSISYAPRFIVSLIERLSSVLAVRTEWSRKMAHFISRSEKCQTRSAMMIVFLYLVDWRTTRAITTLQDRQKSSLALARERSRTVST